MTNETMQRIENIAIGAYQHARTVERLIRYASWGALLIAWILS